MTVQDLDTVAETPADSYAAAPRRNGNNVILEAGDDFVLTPAIEDLPRACTIFSKSAIRCIWRVPPAPARPRWLFMWPPNCGRPVTLIHGDDEFGSSDLIGRDTGYRRREWWTTSSIPWCKTEEEHEHRLGGQPPHHRVPVRLHPDLRRIQPFPRRGQ